MSAETCLEARDVSLHYPQGSEQLVACHKLNFSMAQHDRLVILGPSGCGKSTLLKAIAGFIPTSGGSLTLNHHPIQGPSADRAVVFQEFDQLLPWKTVHENVVFALVHSGLLKREAALVRAQHYLQKVGLGEFLTAYPHTLSGGMKQRVAIARAFALHPKLLLMDEPFAALDALTRQTLQQELLTLSLETRLSLIFVTHSVEEALLIASHILILSPHPGQVQAYITLPDGPRSPQFLADTQEKIERLLFQTTTAKHLRQAA